jgi:hypothetical protein
MKFLLLILLLLVVAGVGTLWIASHLRPCHETFTLRGRVYNLQSREGVLALDFFSTTAEDEAYHHLTLRYGVVEAVASPLAALLLVRYARGLRRVRGFPV